MRVSHLTFAPSHYTPSLHFQMLGPPFLCHSYTHKTIQHRSNLRRRRSSTLHVVDRTHTQNDCENEDYDDSYFQNLNIYMCLKICVKISTLSLSLSTPNLKIFNSRRKNPCLLGAYSTSGDHVIFLCCSFCCCCFLLIDDGQEIHHHNSQDNLTLSSSPLSLLTNLHNNNNDNKTKKSHHIHR